MKKVVFIMGLFLILSSVARAEIYHGIDIDAVYKSSDWNNKEEIKELIDDYTLLLQYQEELNNCTDELPDVLKCYDIVAEKILTNLYVYPEYNIKAYKELKKALSEAYSLKNCRNKYSWPSGHICVLDRISDMSYVLKMYIQDLINFSREKMFAYSAILMDYK